jgi:hypothetical protein
MGVFKSLVDKAMQKSDELARKAQEKRDELARKAAKRAAKTALEQGAKAAMGAIDGAGKAIERVLFGDEERDKERDEERARAKNDDAEDEPAEQARPDPFAKLKAAEAAKAERGAENERVVRAAKHEAEEKEIDAELAALKKKLGQ